MGDSVFAGYLNHLDQHGEIRDRQLFDDMWKALRRVLHRELIRRDLWRLPPSYLGISGFSAWDEEALDDLAQDCYLFVVHERRRSLLAQNRAGQDIDGLVIRNARNFLFEIQKKNDPLGFRIFELLRIAAREASKQGHLRILAGDPRMRNNTVMELPISRSAATLPRDADTVEGETFDDIAILWCDELLPELVTVRGAGVRDCVDRLQELMKGLPSQGVRRFRFGDLVEAVKREARERWSALGSHEMPVQSAAGRVAEGPVAHHELEHRQQYQALVEHLETRVAALPGRRATRSYLRRLLSFLRRHAAEADQPERLPSLRRISETLGIPRDRLRGLLETLRNLADSAPGASAARLPHPSGRGPAGRGPTEPKQSFHRSRLPRAAARPRETPPWSYPSRDRFSPPFAGAFHDGRASP